MTRTWLLVLGVLATVGFASIVLVIVPEIMLVRVPEPEPLEPYTAAERRGREVYVENGCYYCHSQQVRDPAFTTDVERGWGDRPTVPADYVYDDPHLLGTMRTGPDLINVGIRLPDPQWHLIHLYDPRALIEWSIMPAFPFLFEEKDPEDVDEDDVVVPVRGEFAPAGKTVVATADAIALVEYLLSLQRSYPVPTAEGARGQPPEAAADARGVNTMP